MKKTLLIFIVSFLITCNIITQFNLDKVSDANDKLLNLVDTQSKTILTLKNTVRNYEQDSYTPLVFTNNTMGDDPEYNEQEVELLCACVQAEAGENNDIAQKLCTQVIMNRMVNSNFPNTIEDVIHQKINGVAQFSVVYDGRMRSQTVTDRTRRNVMEILLYGGTLPNNVLYFYSDKLKEDKWTKGLKIYKKVEGTVFCVKE